MSARGASFYISFVKRILVLFLLIHAASAEAGNSPHDCHRNNPDRQYGIIDIFSMKTGLMQLRTPGDVKVLKLGESTTVRNAKTPLYLTGKAGEPVGVTLKDPGHPVPEAKEITLKPGIKVPGKVRIKGRTLLSLAQKGPRGPATPLWMQDRKTVSGKSIYQQQYPCIEKD